MADQAPADAPKWGRWEATDKSGKMFTRKTSVKKVTSLCSRPAEARLTWGAALQMMMSFTIIQDCFLNNAGQVTMIKIHR